MVHTAIWITACAVATPFVLVGGSLCYTVCAIMWQRWKYRHIPGPPPHWLLGNIPHTRALGGYHKAWPLWVRQYGPLIKVFVMSKLVVVVADADLARTVLFKFPNHAPFISFSLKLMDERVQSVQTLGLFQTRDSLWRIVRNSWQPAFAPGSLERYKALMAICAEQLCAVLACNKGVTAGEPPGVDSTAAGNGNGGPENDAFVDIHTLLNQMTLEVVGTCAYGVRFNALPSTTSQVTTSHTGSDQNTTGVGPALCAACKDWFETTVPARESFWWTPAAMLPHLTPILSILANAFPDKAFTKQLESHKTMMRVSAQLISDWKAKSHDELQTGSDVKAQAGRLAGIEPGSFLGLLLDAERKAANNPAADKLDDMTIIAQAVQFYLAASETTAASVGFAIYLLCTNPDKEARLLQEVDAHGRDTPITAEDKFPYVDAVIREALRLYPPALGTTRTVSHTPRGTFNLGGYTVHDGIDVLVMGTSMHKDAAYWNRPDEFLPERWLPEGEAELGPRHPNCYIPFGAGTRHCPGYKFAQQEARIALVALYRSFTFKLQPGQEPLECEAGLTLNPKHGIWVKPVSRT